MKGIFLIGVLTAALFPVGLQPQTQPTGRPFSDASLKGSCVWENIAYAATSGDLADAGPTTILGKLTFDGTGHMRVAYDANVNGTMESADVNGEYSISPNGHGEFTFTSPASGYTLTYDTWLSPKGHVLYTMVKTYSGLTVTPRVSAGSCNFQE